MQRTALQRRPLNRDVRIKKLALFSSFSVALTLVLVTAKLLKTEEIAANDGFRKVHGIACSFNIR